MKKLIKPYAFVLYLLTILVFFIIGMFYVKFTGAAEGQGLAAGAIVVGNGVVFAGVAFIIALFVAFHTSRKIILITNTLLLAILFLSLLYFGLKQAGKAKQEPEPRQTLSRDITAPVSKVYYVEEWETENSPPLEKTGLGFYKPDFFSQDVLYFYGNPNLEKSVMEHFPVDSIVFEKQEYGGYSIVYAPPWLQPHHLKLDYDIFYMKIVTLGHEFLEVVVNTSNNKTMYVDRYQGKPIYWPEFLLGTYSIEFPAGSTPSLKYKPFDHAGDVQLMDHYIMTPILVQGDWIKVQLKDNELRNIASGWIRWRQEDHLLIKYALLS